MKIKIILITLIIAVGSAIYFRPTDERKIARNLDLLAQYCSTVNNESAIDTLQKVTAAAKLVKDPGRVIMASFNIDLELSKKEVTDHLLMMKKRLPGTTFIFNDTKITLLDDRSAEVTTTLRLEGRIADDEFTDAYELHAATEKTDGKWRFSSVTVVEFMQK